MKLMTHMYINIAENANNNNKLFSLFSDTWINHYNTIEKYDMEKKKLPYKKHVMKHHAYIVCFIPMNA